MESRSVEELQQIAVDAVVDEDAAADGRDELRAVGPEGDRQDLGGVVEGVRRCRLLVRVPQPQCTVW